MRFGKENQVDVFSIARYARATVFLYVFAFMHHTTEKNNASVTITITVLPEEYQHHLEKAAKRISDRSAIRGFRKGKAPFDIIKKEVGDMAILEEALESIVHEFYYTAVLEEKLDVVGMPKIDVKKIAPANELEFSATVALFPSVSVANPDTITVKKRSVSVDPSQIDKTLAALRGMRAKEAAKSGPAAKDDAIVIDMAMTVDNVPIEGGQANDYRVYLNEDHYIPGFNDQLLGLEKGSTKEFSLTFPDTHYQKQLAGKKVAFIVTAKEVFDRELPELTDEFAKTLGQESAQKLRERIEQNIFEEEQKKANDAAEIEILEKMIDASSFGEIPDILIDAEREKMMFELRRDLERHNVSIDQYLGDIKKKEKDLFEEFKERAVRRVKASLLSRQIAQEQNFTVEDAELQSELAALKDIYKDNAEYRDRLKRPEVKDTIAIQLQNKKVMAWLKAKILGEDMMDDPNLSKMGCKDCNDENHDHTHGDSHGHANTPPSA
ncbi:MAG: trigger factor [Candidatus Magasanikbacteria bacterium RIFCSPLOWO2_12_FULL_47_9b]|nr:MAG: trigger factor [Candidatus Magasanikbacteria bacterium RIFCSPLOWO2_02_FULL_47_16]OGH79634.1 MAG: trigger factor [Candidatus Magasanikbacteria bacterium RIFCSPHIGHO2_02_FULL_48_18]OGH82346.1 MAG: trigger factor [Candidatus Magasanikbacteria bacterium RIFCSPLOWO2_12_FULL_47_9b]